VGRPACLVCGGRAAVYVPYLGGHLCAGHFVEWFERRVRDTVERFGLVEPGDRVAVAVSGGKDSLALLSLLARWSGEMGFEVFGVAVDEGIRGYREYKLEALRRLAEELGAPIHVGGFKEYVGFTLDEAVAVLRERGMEFSPCSVCGVFRRYVMNRVARDLGATKLATGHNLDDEVQVYVMNLLKAHLEGVAREGIATAAGEEGLVPRIKPFYFVREKETLTYALLRGIWTPFVECPYVVYALRHVVRHWINRVASGDEEAKYRLLASKEATRGLLGGAGRVTRRCVVCGEPSSKPVCKACLFRAYLDESYARLVADRVSAIWDSLDREARSLLRRVLEEEGGEAGGER